MKLGLVGLIGLGLSGCMTSDGSIATSGKIEKETIDKTMYSLFEPYNHFEEQHPDWLDEMNRKLVYD